MVISLVEHKYACAHKFTELDKQVNKMAAAFVEVEDRDKQQFLDDDEDEGEEGHDMSGSDDAFDDDAILGVIRP